MQAILSLGGSLIVPEGIDIAYLTELRNILRRRIEQGDKFVIICGGGKICRVYQKALDDLGEKSTLQKDLVGIAVTKVNAELVRAMLGPVAAETIIENPSAPLTFSHPILIGAGYKPGCSTDYDAVLVAEQLGIKTIINLSNITHVYNKDPRTHSDAKPYETMSWTQFRSLVGDTWEAGMNAPFDPKAAKRAEELGMRVIIANGKDLANVEAILDGKVYVGTTIAPR